LKVFLKNLVFSSPGQWSSHT